MYQELTLQLTDPLDPFFFYSLTLTESDFGALRRQQGLIVDFAQFPAMITKLADKASYLQKWMWLCIDYLGIGLTTRTSRM